MGQCLDTVGWVTSKEPVPFVLKVGGGLGEGDVTWTWVTWSLLVKVGGDVTWVTRSQ